MIEPEQGALMGWDSGRGIVGSMIISELLEDNDVVARLDYRTTTGVFRSCEEETMVEEDDEMVIERPEP